MLTPSNKNLSRCFKIFALFLSIILIIPSCSPKKSPLTSLSPEEKVWMTKMFKDLLLSEGGIFTLWGSKPITRIVVYHYSDQQIEEYLSTLTSEQKKNSRILKDPYDLPENWAKWEKIADRYPFPRYLLFHIHSKDDPECSFIYLVDILKTACIIQENYSDFKKVVGYDFEPLEVVLSMPSGDINFWDRMNSYTWGLLFGYGKENSLAFQWKYSSQSEECAYFINNLGYRSSEIFTSGEYRPTLNNLEIPFFFSFVQNDPVIKKYKKERLLIQNVYKHKDFLELTLQQLSEN